MAKGVNALEIDVQLSKDQRFVAWWGKVETQTGEKLVYELSKKEIDLYNLVLKVQEEAINKIKIGVRCADVDLYSRKLFGKYNKYFLHTIGHGVGKKVHCSPKISPKSKQVFCEGIIFTIEPGLYFKNKFGIRIEDTLILKNKPIILSNKLSKKLVVVKSFS